MYELAEPTPILFRNPSQFIYAFPSPFVGQVFLPFCFAPQRGYPQLGCISKKFPLVTWRKKTGCKHIFSQTAVLVRRCPQAAAKRTCSEKAASRAAVLVRRCLQAAARRTWSEKAASRAAVLVRRSAHGGQSTSNFTNRAWKNSKLGWRRTLCRWNWTNREAWKRVASIL